ncbi:hypothetical protein FHL15_011235 [Xylaria flabelliformis]|uniref:Uncharacterized protein n=1 Tax=Xylaria flabelliformis TaxID=2512241 RepID=A0A553HIU1_9PEZI|nr:hypothetical protein FHL15_011235 [Xylaria flabelliformis]
MLFDEIFMPPKVTRIRRNVGSKLKLQRGLEHLELPRSAGKSAKVRSRLNLSILPTDCCKPFFFRARAIPTVRWPMADDPVEQ